jgi:hypothetical protein
VQYHIYNRGTLLSTLLSHRLHCHLHGPLVRIVYAVTNSLYCHLHGPLVRIVCAVSNSLYCHLHGPLVRIVCAEAVEELDENAVHLVQCMSSVYEYSV